MKIVKIHRQSVRSFSPEKNAHTLWLPLRGFFSVLVSDDCCRLFIFLPAAGYRNNSDLNNAGSWGNYWSSSLNEDNPNNAYELNFNSGNVNRNNNNRYYGQSVRPVCQ